MSSLSFGNLFGLQQTAQKHVKQNMNGLTQTMTRLATGKRINSAKDDPAGLIASELLRSENTSIRAQIKSTQALGNRLSVTDSYLSSVSNILNDIKGAIVEGANSGALSDDQIDALQQQIDYAVDAVQKIFTTASYKGEKLLDDFYSGGGSNKLDTSSCATQGIPDSAKTLNFNVEGLGEIRLLSEDSLTNLRFQLDESRQEDGGLFQGLARILGTIVSSVGGEVLTIRALNPTNPEEEASEDATEESPETVDPNANAADSDKAKEESGVGPEGANAVEASAVEGVEADKESGESTEENAESADPEAAASAAEEFQAGKENAVTAEETDKSDEKKAAESKDEKAEEEESEVVGGSGYIFRMNTETVDPSVTEPEAQTPVSFETDLLMQALIAGMDGGFINETQVGMTAFKAATCPAPAACPNTDKTVETDPLKEEDDKKSDQKGEEEMEEDEDDFYGFSSLLDLKKGGSASLKNDPERASKIIDQALSAVFLERARVGAEQKYTVDVGLDMLQDQLIRNTEAEAMYTDADFATEASNLARYQLLLQSSMKVLQITQELPKMLFQLLDAGFSSMKTDAKRV